MFLTLCFLLHVHETLRNYNACPSSLPSRAPALFNTLFSGNLDLFHQTNQVVLASWGACWQKASQFKARGRTSPTAALILTWMAAESALRTPCEQFDGLSWSCWASASQSICNVQVSVWRGESVIKTPKASSSAPVNAQPWKKRKKEELQFWPEVCVAEFSCPFGLRPVADVWSMTGNVNTVSAGTKSPERTTSRPKACSKNNTTPKCV